MAIHWGGVAEVVIGGLAVAGAVAFVGMVVWYIKMKPTLEGIKKDISSLKEWKEGLGKQGGAITRNDHFAFCKDMQGKCSEGVVCRLGNLEDWRDAMLDRGGPLTMKEHLSMCERVIEKVTVDSVRRINEGLNHHRELVVAEFGAMRALIQKDVLEAIQTLGREMKEHNGKNK